MKKVNSTEYAKVISETVAEKESRDCYEANLLNMGKDSAAQIQDAFNQGKILALKYILQTYKAVREHYSNQAGLTFEVLDAFFAECTNDIMEEI